ncbi:MAG TPA: putative sulfate exporter family transporter [Rhodanobacteraceae bacterium]|nr:putative sulfate exporter family transporter [Rhodanobacteraceae bacterium]
MTKPGGLLRLWPGLALALLVAAVAWQLGRWEPLVGGPVFGIVLGLVVRALWTPPTYCAPGLRFASRKVLQGSIVVLGLGLGLGQVAQTGLRSLSVTAVTIAAAFVAAAVLGRLLGVPSKLKLLIGVGTAICGASAIAAVTPIVEPDEHETAYAISTIFLFNVIAVLAFPLLGHLMHLSDAGFGLWAGTAINDTSSVVAAGYSYSQAAGDFATIVKLTRATLIIPICLLLAAAVAWRHRRAGQHGGTGFSLRRVFPWFIAWFVLASVLCSVGGVPDAWQPVIHRIAEALIVVALSAIGLGSDLRRMLASGARPLLLGFGVWAAVALGSLGMQFVLGQL